MVSPKYFHLIFLFALLLCIKETKSEIDIFRDIKKLSFNNNYFVILNTGIYIYNKYLLDCKLIFNLEHSPLNQNSNYQIITTELIDNNRNYILSMINEYLFIFNEETNKIFFIQLDKEYIIPTNYYTLLPSKIRDNILSFIIALYKDSSNIIFYYNELSLDEEKIIESKNQIYNVNYINNKFVRCLINNYLSQIYCFFFQTINNINYFNSAYFFINETESNFINCFQDYNYLTDINNDIKDLAVILSDNNKFLIIIYLDVINTYINDYSTNILEKIDCLSGIKPTLNYKINYYKETREFDFTSRTETNMFMVNSLDNKCNVIYKFFPKQDEIYDFSVIYNNTINNYSLINHLNFENNRQCNEINPIGYYINENNIYQKCYSNCDYCINKGNDIYHNCTECNKKFFYELHFDLIDTINCYKKCLFNSYYNETSKKYYCTINSSCPEEYNKLIPEKNICIDKCDKDSNSRYEFRHTCYEKCPEDISVNSKTIKFYCEAICTKEFPFEIISTQYCVNTCTISQRQKGLCKINYESKEETNNEQVNKEVEDKALQNIQEELIESFDTSEIDEGENIVIKLKDSIVTISTTENQKKEETKNVSTIDLGECENKIKKEYNIPKNKSLYIFKLDINQEGYKIPKIEYEVYYPLFNDGLVKLNLTACKDVKINLNIPLKIEENIDKLNSSSGYYNDICYTTTSENGTDISLSDRKKNFVNNNLSVCEEDCDFVEYNMGKAVCSCKVKTNSVMKVSDMTIDKDKLFNNFVDFKNIANIQILKCYKLIFKLRSLKNNYGNIFMIIIIFFLFLTIIIFYRKDLPNLKEYFYKILFLKINSKKVSQIVKNKIKEEERLNRQKIIDENNNNINNINNLVTNKRKRSKTKLNINDNQNNQKNNEKEFIIEPPVYLIYKQAIKESSNANPYQKKAKRNKKDKKDRGEKNNINIITINNDDNNNSNRVIDNINFSLNLGSKIIKLDENQIFKMATEINPLTISELNDLKYKDALKKDNRTFCLYYLSLIKTNHIIYFSFISFLDFNSRIIKIFLFFFNFSTNFTVNALFLMIIVCIKYMKKEVLLILFIICLK